VFSLCPGNTADNPNTNRCSSGKETNDKEPEITLKKLFPDFS